MPPQWRWNFGGRTMPETSMTPRPLYGPARQVRDIGIILKRGRSGAKSAATNRRVGQQKNAWQGATC